MSDLYAGIDDPGIEQDMQAAIARGDRLEAAYRGKLAALTPRNCSRRFRVLRALSIAPQGRLIRPPDLVDGSRPTRSTAPCAEGHRESAPAAAVVFFELEWINAPEPFAQAMIAHPVLDRYRHWLEVFRLYQPHKLTEPEEKDPAEKAVTGAMRKAASSPR